MVELDTTQVTIAGVGLANHGPAANRSTRSTQDSSPNLRHTATFESQRVGFR